jgi:sialic acid synthase SpsE
MADKFGLSTGYSDHTAGILASVSAVASGAKIIEKHFTLDKKLPGPDHKASLEPNELKQMIEQIREVETMLGDGKKAPRKSELKYIKIVRRGLYKTAKGYIAMRPQNKLNPMNSWKLFEKI